MYRKESAPAITRHSRLQLVYSRLTGGIAEFSHLYHSDYCICHSTIKNRLSKLPKRYFAVSYMIVHRVSLSAHPLELRRHPLVRRYLPAITVIIVRSTVFAEMTDCRISRTELEVAALRQMPFGGSGRSHLGQIVNGRSDVVVQELCLAERQHCPCDTRRPAIPLDAELTLYRRSSLCQTRI